MLVLFLLQFLALAPAVQTAESICGEGVTTSRCFPIPLGGLTVILFGALAHGVHFADMVLPVVRLFPLSKAQGEQELPGCGHLDLLGFQVAALLFQNLPHLHVYFC